MKREDLKKLLGDGVADDVIDAIMKLHGSDIETHKVKLTELQGQFDSANSQLTEANKQIASFQGMDVEAIKKAAADWEAKAKQIETDAATNLAKVKFEHALDGALAGAKAKNPKAVKALLDMEVLQKAYDEKTGTIVNFDEHIKPVKEANDYLFEGEKKDPKIVTNTNNQPVITDAFEAALWKGAGLKPPGEQPS